MSGVQKAPLFLLEIITGHNLFFRRFVSVKVGTILEGTIERVLPYGVFVLLPEGESGLLHKSKVKDLALLAAGKIVTVKVLSVSREGKIELKESAGDPVVQGTKVNVSDMFGLPSGIKVTEDKSLNEQLKQFANKSRSRLGDALEWELRKSGKKKKK